MTRTHDPQHVLVALLDLEDQTSRLFATIPHLAEVLIDDQPILLHARTREQVLEYLGKGCYRLRQQKQRNRFLHQKSGVHCCYKSSCVMIRWILCCSIPLVQLF